MYSLDNNIQAIHYCTTHYIIEKAVFFSDYADARWFLNFCNKSEHYDVPLVNENYYFLDVQPALEKSFSKVIDAEDYINIIKRIEYLLSDDVQTCLESLHNGNKPIFFMKKGNFIKNTQVLYENNIPIISGKNLDELMQNYETSIQNYKHQVFNTLYI
ncbi:MAG: hypothetical protein ACI9TV_002246 [Sulfurimonas sp.]|jgi:hypothetical protein|uniref:hypothetical protein n=1 Tax=Sulfurimonas sp. TaxID=2022749 RepID=UPI0039E403B1